MGMKKLFGALICNTLFCINFPQVENSLKTYHTGRVENSYRNITSTQGNLFLLKNLLEKGRSPDF